MTGKSEKKVQHIFHARMQRYSRELSFSRQQGETLSSKISPLKVSETFFDCLLLCVFYISSHKQPHDEKVGRSSSSSSSSASLLSDEEDLSTI